MRIAIDLTAMPPLRRGVGFYLTHLIEALQQVDCENEYVLLANSASAQAIQLRAPNFSLSAVHLRNRPARLFWEQVALPGRARRLAIDVLHSPHYTRPLGSLACASVLGVMDLTFFVLPGHHTLAKRAFFPQMIRRGVRKADRIIVISQSTQRDLCALLNVPPAKVDTIPLAASAEYRPDISDEQKASVRARYNLPRHYVLFVGTLEPRKNLLGLLAAYHQLVTSRHTVPDLVLVGARGWHTRPFDDAVTQFADRVHTPGYIPEEDLPSVYAGATAFVYPSLYEGFGIPILEALASGVPTVTSNISSMPEVAGDAALLVDPRNPRELALALARVVEDSALRKSLAERGPRRAALFSWRRAAELTVQSYARAWADWKSSRAADAQTVGSMVAL